ncbi:multicopper oxidase family protein [Longirhabdus pacifica]|uniref:multicopper oxidase family protein n=1 Tax=Longirhabdus pacifica TaxID=2305227 RepID=UPI0010089F20|nr:multicopper oxidase family protein [Longirhabdus pacifica]
MKNFKVGLLWITLMMVSVLLASCGTPANDKISSTSSQEAETETTATTGTEETETIETTMITLEAKPSHWMFNDEVMNEAWLYNGSFPGPEIKVKQGDHVTIRLQNSLPDLTSLHIHGLPIPNEMDGVPGVTQNAIIPGEYFDYSFVASENGTYWYHSHQNGSEQVEKGLYGALIVEPRDMEEVAIDKTIMIDEISSMEMSMNMDMHEDMDMNMHEDMSEDMHEGMDMDMHEEMSEDMHEGMDMDMHEEMSAEMDENMDMHSDMHTEEMDGDHHDSQTEMSHAELMKEMYDTMIINGLAASAIEPILVNEDDKIRLRFVNAGLFTQVIHIPGHAFTVTHYDGQSVYEPGELKDVALRIAPAERYDVEINMTEAGAWGIQVYAEESKDKLNVTIPLVYNGYEEEALQMNEPSSYFDMTQYGKALELDIGEVTKQYTMSLDTNDGGETFTINDKQSPDHEVFGVEEGDIVKVTIVNNSDADHPMHLHGQFFHVVSKNGEAIQGAPIVKDTLNVRPNETYEVIFAADNPGNWLFHCHELHHASSGMVSEVKYKDYGDFEADPTIANQPE